MNAIALLAASVGRASGGLAVSRPGVDDGRLIAVASGVGAAGLLALVAGDGLVLVAVPLVVLAAVSLSFGAIFETAATADRRDAAAVAIVVAAGNAASLVLPAIGGRVRDLTGSYEPAFFLLALLNIGAVVAGAAISRGR